MLTFLLTVPFEYPSTSGVGSGLHALRLARLELMPGIQEIRIHGSSSLFVWQKNTTKRPYFPSLLLTFLLTFGKRCIHPAFLSESVRYPCVVERFRCPAMAMTMANGTPADRSEVIQ